MRPFALGVDFRTASQPLRDMLAYLPRDPVPPGCAEAMWLVTPERIELHGTAYDPVGPEMAWQELGGAYGTPAPYVWWDRDARTYLAQVAAGCHSLIPGDPRPLEQVTAAARTAMTAGGLGPGLGERVMLALGLARRARQESGLASVPGRLADQIVTLAERLFERLDRCRLLALGEGGEALVAPLSRRGVAGLSVLAPGEAMAARLGAEWLPPEPLPDSLARGDILITALTLGRPVITGDDLRAALKRRRRRPILLVDLGQPGDVAADVAGLEDVFVWRLADLARMAYQGAADVGPVIAKAEALIAGWLQTADQAPAVVSALDLWAEGERQAVLAEHPADAGAATAALLARLLAGPRAALSGGAVELDGAARRLFGLAVTVDEDEER